VRIDLHIHTDASDGSYTPAEVLDRALQLHLGAIAITDHDTVAGVEAALASGIPTAIGFLTGVEISAAPPPSYPRSGSFHILGYDFRPQDPNLRRELQTLQEARRDRNPRIIERLNRIGVPIRLEDVASLAGSGQIGRPHIADCLVRTGAATSIDDAFDRLLGTGRPAYVDKYRIDCSRAVDLIRNAGGIAVLAHPGLLVLDEDSQLDRIVVELCALGLKGLEVFYPGHSASLTRQLLALAKRHGLLVTGGTDFHGTIQPDIEMGVGSGDLHVPYELYEKLKAYRCEDRK
jgi:predicted metal-dependent phosphoesterase TrpH